MLGVELLPYQHAIQIAGHDIMVVPIRAQHTQRFIRGVSGQSSMPMFGYGEGRR